MNKNKNRITNIKNGDFIQFKNNNTKYYEGKNITKQILASSGDIIKIIQFNNPKNGVQANIQFNNIILDVKDFTSLGTKLSTNNVKIIPENYFFVIGTHKNSFDSRYKEFGLINKEDIIGVAISLF